LLTGKKVALKCIEKRRINNKSALKKIFSEILIMKKAVHKNIIKLLEVFENKQYIFLVMEFAEGGDLLKIIKKIRKMEENSARKYLLQIVKAIKYCHDNAILHRDIKLDNILIHHGQIKLCDFGVSRFVIENQIIKE